MNKLFPATAVTTVLVTLALGLFGPMPRALAADGVTEWSTENRIVLSFRVKEAALQALLPPDWTVASSTAPVSRGSNLTVSMMERKMVLDPQGKPLRTGTSHYVVMSVPAQNARTGQPGTLVVIGISPEGSGAYGVYLPATISRLERSSVGSGEEFGSAREQWEFGAASGERIEFRLNYRPALPVKSHVESVVRSAARPEFQRTYRIDQGADLLRSTATGIDRIEELTFRATGPKLAPIFDGSEELVSVTAIPYYVREISVP